MYNKNGYTGIYSPLMYDRLIEKPGKSILILNLAKTEEGISILVVMCMGVEHLDLSTHIYCYY